MKILKGSNLYNNLFLLSHNLKSFKRRNRTTRAKKSIILAHEKCEKLENSERGELWTKRKIVRKKKKIKE